jgi:L-alanine-DL-glutamate epimerase-like enolase superfamily enzyme
VPDKIRDVKVATILAPLPKPVRFGPWLMKHREFVLCTVRSTDGVLGQAFCYTRDGPVAAIVRRQVAANYLGQSFDEPAELSLRAGWTNNPVLAGGIGHRALGLVDLATWDLKARAAGVPIGALLGGESGPLPATAIVGYPPSTDADEVRDQVRNLFAAGWRRFKQPVAANEELTLARLHAAHEAAPEAWHGLDANWIYKSADAAIAFTKKLDGLPLGWFEDVVPPGDAAMVAEIRRGSDVPIAMGDEQGGAYHPDALLSAEAVDVIRVDVTTNGGLSRLQPILGRIAQARVPFSTHMFAHMHSQIFSALGYKDVPIEWGVRWTGVDQFADSLRQPVIRDGLMEPLPAAPGFGELVNRDWLSEQIVDDPDHLLGDFDR